MTKIKHIYEIRPRKDKRGFDLISDALATTQTGYIEIRELDIVFLPHLLF